MESKESIVRDGFRVVKTRFIVPQNTGQLDPQTKRKATICNLFVNHQLPIGDVIRVLDESYSHTIGVLIAQGVIEGRRKVPRTANDSSNRQGLRSRLKKPL
jgi:hypothetical protein